MKQVIIRIIIGLLIVGSISYIAITYKSEKLKTQVPVLDKQTIDNYFLRDSTKFYKL